MRRTFGALLLVIVWTITGGTALAQVPEESPIEPEATVPPAVVEVIVLDDRFSQARLTVKAGTTVTWVHKGNNFHTTSATEGAWDSGTIQRGDTFSYTFTDPGTYAYLCRQHLLQGMRGTITVEAE